MVDQPNSEPRLRTKDRPEVMVVMKRIGERVTALRQARGLSLQELSRRSDLSPRVVHRIERAEGDVQIGTLMLIAAQLDSSVVELIEG